MIILACPSREPLLFSEGMTIIICIIDLTIAINNSILYTYLGGNSRFS